MLEIIVMACITSLTFYFLDVTLWWWAPKLETIITTLDSLLKFIFNMLEYISLARSGEEIIIKELHLKITPMIFEGKFGYKITELYPKNMCPMTAIVYSPSTFGLVAGIFLIVLIRWLFI